MGLAVGSLLPGIHRRFQPSPGQGTDLGIAVLVIMNPRAAGGQAGRRWKRIEAELMKRLGPFDLLIIDDFEIAAGIIREKARMGERRFVAAGGDGTVNFLLNVLMNALSADSRSEIAIGAVGLGSSNDFHKPFNPDSRIDAIPCRIDFAAAAPHDVGAIEYSDSRGDFQTRYWLINASAGITAEANRFFNSPDRVLGYLKRSSTGLAILYSALSTMFRYRARRVRLEADGETAKDFEIENLGVVKNPHFSGSFRYDSPCERDSGRFYLHIVEKRSLISKLRLLYLLGKSKRSSRNLTICRQIECAALHAEEPLAIEFDGEIVVTDEVRFTICKKALRVVS
jgi:diacylglycerol kinase family enzyme